ncbi:MAG: sulfatase family protein [Promethearchaeota archaeon]
MNLLFIITDQQRADQLSCMGNPVLKTPNIDSIVNDANGGIKFTNYYCNTPICMPNRANFFTGCYPSVHGTRSNGINLNPEVPTISEILRQQGYHTITIGKSHFNFYAPPYNSDVESKENIRDWILGKIGNNEPFPTPYYGFEEVKLTVGHGDIMTGHYMNWAEEKSYNQTEYLKKHVMKIFEYYYETPLPEKLYPTTYITDQTVDFLERYSKEGDKPFFLHCSFNDPHHPVCPPGKYKDMYKPEDIELPSNFNNGEKLLEHEFLGPHLKDKRFGHLLPQLVDKHTAKEFIALYYGSITMIDDGVGKILDTLKKSGLADNTMVIFTSDHGDLCGHHGLILKGPAHYRGLINIPLLWRVPGMTKKGVSRSLVSTVDLPKTILNILGIAEKYQPKTFQGLDITPILKNPDKKVRDRVLIEHDEELAGDKVMRLRTLVTKRYRLTLYDGYENTGDIFDLKEDPDEVNNLWHTNQDLKNKLTEELLREIVSLRPRLPKRNAYN